MSGIRLKTEDNQPSGVPIRSGLSYNQLLHENEILSRALIKESIRLGVEYYSCRYCGNKLGDSRSLAEASNKHAASCVIHIARSVLRGGK